MTKLKHTSGELALKIGDDNRRATIITEDGREVMNIEVPSRLKVAFCLLKHAKENKLQSFMQ